MGTRFGNREFHLVTFILNINLVVLILLQGIGRSDRTYGMEEDVPPIDELNHKPEAAVRN